MPLAPPSLISIVRGWGSLVLFYLIYFKSIPPMLCVRHNFFIFYLLFNIIVLSPHMNMRGVSFFSSINVFNNIFVIIFFFRMS